MTAQPTLFDDTPPAPDRLGRLLAIIATDHTHHADRERILRAIARVADQHHGIVDSGNVRRALTSNGGLQVNPRVLSATYSQLARAGLLERHGWTTNDDVAGGNQGKPCRRWRLVVAS